MSAAATEQVSLRTLVRKLRDSLERVIRGKRDVIENLVAALLAGGSVLLEDVPGVGKTTLAKALAASLDLEFRRVQCTPDLLPADIFGFSVFQPHDGTFRFRPGPVFCNILLLDEINRASPRTQSALLEAMAERQVTVEAVHHPLPTPFMVIATQNPIGYRGTFPLPEAQLDRFLFQISLGYPDAESEIEMLYDQADASPADNVRPALTREELAHCQRRVRQVRLERSVAAYLVELVRKTRDDERLKLGGSPRGSLMLFRAAQSFAALEDRDFVVPDDVQRAAPLVLQHRISAARGSEFNFAAHREIVAEIVAATDVPV